jgi:Bacterial Ig-like domain (group 3)
VDAQQTIKANLDVKAGTLSLIPATPPLPSLMVDLLDGPDPYVIPAGGDVVKEISVKLNQTGGAAPNVVLLVITSSAYAPDIKFTTDGAGGTKREWFSLEFPQVFLGHGAVSIFAENPETLYFKNTTANNVIVSVTLGRARSSTTTTLEASKNTGAADFKPTFTATVTVSGAGAGVPGGSVTFTDGTTAVGPDVPLDAKGKATTSASSLSVGTHKITAGYSGDSANLSSTSDVLTYVVDPPTAAPAGKPAGRDDRAEKPAADSHREQSY